MDRDPNQPAAPSPDQGSSATPDPAVTPQTYASQPDPAMSPMPGMYSAMTPPSPPESPAVSQPNPPLYAIPPQAPPGQPYMPSAVGYPPGPPFPQQPSMPPQGYPPQQFAPPQGMPPGYVAPPPQGAAQPQYSLPPNAYRAPAMGYPATGYPSQPAQGYPSQPYPYVYAGAPSMAPVPTATKSNATLIIVLSIVAAIAIIAGSIGIVLANHGAYGSSIGNGGSSGTTTGSVAPGDHGIGEVVTVDGTWAMTVTGATTTMGDQFDQSQLKAGDTYLVVSITVKNITSATQYLIGAIGYSVRTPSNTLLQEGFLSSASPPDGNITGGVQMSGQVPFEVSASDHHFQFIYDSDSTYGPPVTWDISV